MYITIDKYDFIAAFKRHNREDNFSREGLELLFDYLEEYENATEPMELDVIAICCDFSEDSVDDLWNILGDDDDDTSHLDEADLQEYRLDKLVDILEYNGTLIGVTSSQLIVHQNY